MAAAACPCDRPRVRPGLDAILFDLDGTLVDSVGLILDTYRHTMRAYAADPLPGDDVWLARIGEPLVDVLAPYAAQFGVPIDTIVATYREHYVLHHDDRTRVFDGVFDVLEGLAARGVRLGLVSGKSRVGIERTVSFTGLDRFFRVRIGADDCPTGKPDPGPLHLAAARLGADPARTAYVGDAPVDVRAAKAAGMWAVAVRWGPFPPEVIDPLGPDEVVEAVADLARLVGVDP